VCARFPNLESLNLINSQGITDASAPQFLKLPKLKRLLINGPKITAAILKNVGRLPLEELLVAQGAINPPSDAIASLQTVPTLRRLSIEGPPLTDAHLGALAGLSQLQELSFEALPLPENRLQQLRAFAFLKKLTLALRPKGYPQEIQAAVRTLLPHVDVQFVQ
jgi:Leucine-rich repeat (LRR) protein